MNLSPRLQIFYFNNDEGPNWSWSLADNLATADYFSDVLIVPKRVLSAVPRPFTDAMIAMAMPAAIKAYSIAVAPD